MRRGLLGDKWMVLLFLIPVACLFGLAIWNASGRPWINSKEARIAELKSAIRSWEDLLAHPKRFKPLERTMNHAEQSLSSLKPNKLIGPRHIDLTKDYEESLERARAELKKLLEEL